MLVISVPKSQGFDEKTNSFVEIKSQVLKFEHSLLSISKWESKYEKSFLHTKNKTNEEALYYIKCMCITPNVDDSIFLCLGSDNYKQINDYIGSSNTATVITDNTPKKSNREILTSELIYYYMVAYRIPFKCEQWHLNRLLTLIKICNIKQEDPKKMPKSKIRNQNAALNRARRAKAHSRG